MFGFDEQYPYYGVTPVDNQFILEYLPGASGDAVRVYLYGLMQCYHPQGMTIEQMARELGMDREAILAAYRHWERKGLVRRIADDPPTYRYISVKQLASMGGAAFQVDEAYVAFCEALQGIFGDRKVHGSEQARCYEWVEEFRLPADAVLELVRHMVQASGKNVTIKAIEKMAMELSDEGVQSLEDARVVLGREKAVRDGSRAVLSQLGKRRAPTVAEMDLYRTWMVDWLFTREDILAACGEMTSGEPSFKYLGGILSRIRQKQQGAKVAEVLASEKEQDAPLRALLKVMPKSGAHVNDETRALYEEMRTLYPDAIILMAGQECARHGSPFKDVMPTLRAWKREGLEDAADITRYMQRVEDLNDFLRMLYDALGVSAKPNAADRRLAARWLEEYRYDAAFLTQCAPWAVGKEKPLAYLAAMLEAFWQKGVRTLEDAQRERESFAAKQAAAAPARTGKVVGEQQYTQREYTHSEDAMDAMMKQWQEENGHA